MSALPKVQKTEQKTEKTQKPYLTTRDIDIAARIRAKEVPSQWKPCPLDCGGICKRDAQRCLSCWDKEKEAEKQRLKTCPVAMEKRRQAARVKRARQKAAGIKPDMTNTCRCGVICSGNRCRACFNADAATEKAARIAAKPAPVAPVLCVGCGSRCKTGEAYCYGCRESARKREAAAARASNPLPCNLPQKVAASLGKKCVECQEPISHTSTRCRSCSSTHSRNMNKHHRQMMDSKLFVSVGNVGGIGGTKPEPPSRKRMTKGLTPAQITVADLILNRAHDLYTFQRIADHMGIDKPTVMWHVRSLCAAWSCSVGMLRDSAFNRGFGTVRASKPKAEEVFA